MNGRRRERRRNSGEFRVRPPSSPANLLVLTVTGALMASAAATVLVDGGMEEKTPHGQLLSALRIVAERQEAHHRQEGEFAGWLRTLEWEAPADIQLTVIEGDVDRWEALARHPVGLACSQGGTLEDGRVKRDPPVCFTTTLE